MTLFRLSCIVTAIGQAVIAALVVWGFVYHNNADHPFVSGAILIVCLWAAYISYLEARR